ncbi:MAG: hypothetical protein J5X22_19060 [Candidatus Accumulibacter sp.]|uniref:hypothetical protein n=1 Tax=Accumulibacter sp. TaxID=2053492 RepID=UPI001AC3B18F|nr:hypothetical protein [Accumulibacter sp.]MBN8518372.1 hypothetical protein [Accumulibacter sp.]MBO3712514.1 hypothetical protein [Accumulibacter sp.]
MGTTLCRDAMRQGIGAGRSTQVPVAATDSQRESIIQTIYHLAVNHDWGSGEALRQLGKFGDGYAIEQPGRTGFVAKC